MNAAWVAVGLTAVSLAWTVYRSLSRRQNRRAARQAPAELREGLTDMVRLFDDIIADGGKEKSWFLEGDQKRVVMVVRDQVYRADDAELRRSALAAAMSWDQACACAPPDAEPVVLIGDRSDGQYRQRMVEHYQRLSRVADVAEEGIDHCRAAITRLNGLEKCAPEP
jgi:hypothetical protein